MSYQTYSFCKKCERYHVNFKKDNMDTNKETHLSLDDIKEAESFLVYWKDVKELEGVVQMAFVCPSFAKKYHEDKMPWLRSIRRSR